MRIVIFTCCILYITAVFIAGIPLKIKLQKKYGHIIGINTLDSLTESVFDSCEKNEELKKILAQLKIYQAHSLIGSPLCASVVLVYMFFLA